MTTPEATARVLYEDEAVLAVDKPAGIAVIPERTGPAENSLVEQLRAQRREQLFVVHRLDRETSGVLLFARDATSHRALSMAFERRAARKRYVALTRGLPPATHGTIDLPLHSARRGKMRPAAPGEEGSLASETDYLVEGAWQTRVGPVARVELAPRTGRQHQLRVHLRAVESPIVVDPIYGRCEGLRAGELGEGAPALGRTALHALALTVPHPSHGRPLEVRAEIAADLAALVAWLATQPPHAR